MITVLFYVGPWWQLILASLVTYAPNKCQEQFGESKLLGLGAGLILQTLIPEMGSEHVGVLEPGFRRVDKAFLKPKSVHLAGLPGT